MKSIGAGFARHAVNTVGSRVVKTLVAALWYIAIYSARPVSREGY
jgi:hypothetical protein